MAEVGSPELDLYVFVLDVLASALKLIVEFDASAFRCLLILLSIGIAGEG